MNNEPTNLSIENLPKGAHVQQSLIEIEPGEGMVEVNFIRIDGDWYWNIEGCDTLWGPHPTRAAARAHMLSK